MENPAAGWPRTRAGLDLLGHSPRRSCSADHHHSAQNRQPPTPRPTRLTTAASTTDTSVEHSAVRPTERSACLDVGWVSPVTRVAPTPHLRSPQPPPTVPAHRAWKLHRPAPPETLRPREHLSRTRQWTVPPSTVLEPAAMPPPPDFVVLRIYPRAPAHRPAVNHPSSNARGELCSPPA